MDVPNEPCELASAGQGPPRPRDLLARVLARDLPGPGTSYVASAGQGPPGPRDLLASAGQGPPGPQDLLARVLARDLLVLGPRTS